MKIPNFDAFLTPIGIHYQQYKVAYQLGSAGACVYAAQRILSRRALLIGSAALTGVIYHFGGHQLRSYLMDKIDKIVRNQALRFLFPQDSAFFKYTHQVETMKQENQKTEKSLIDLQNMNQRLDELKTKMASGLNTAEQQIEKAKQKVAADHEKALELQKLANLACDQLETQVDLLFAEAKRLFEIQGDLLPEALQVLSEFKECHKTYQNMSQEFALATCTMEAAVQEFQEISPLLAQTKAEEADLLRQLNELSQEKT